MKKICVWKAMTFSALLAITGCDRAATRENTNGVSSGSVPKDIFRLAAADGQERGNGSDYQGPEQGSAWFLGPDRVIRICHQVSPTFGVEPARAEAALRFAFRTWGEYVNQKIKDDGYGVPFITPFFATKFEILESCNGEEDVAVYFGVRNAEVNQSSHRHENPVAMSVRRSYDMNRGWSKGFVWVASAGSVAWIHSQRVPVFPDWSKSAVLDMILLHEVGHIFGNGHVDDTIMRAEIAMAIEFGTSDELARDFNQIDHARELVLCWDCEEKREGRLGVWTGHEEQPVRRPIGTFERNFKLLTGRDAVGEVRAEVRGVLGKSAVLVVSDDMGSADFPLIVDRKRAGSRTKLGRSFKRIINDKDTWLMIHQDIFATAEHGNLKTVDGRNLRITIERNMTSALTHEGKPGYWGSGPVMAPLIITYELDGANHLLFADREPEKRLSY